MRLDRLDSYLTRFPARVQEVTRDDRGTWLRLDSSAFYPTAGGQPHDTGKVGDVPVVDVAARDGSVWHLLDGDPSLTPGDDVLGEVDWERRFTHMQRHSGQHLLSQAFVRVGAAKGAEEDGQPGFHTRSVSMRGPDCTLDLTGDPEEEYMVEAELEVNRAARLALPVLTFEVDDSRLGDYRLRRPAKVSGLVRLVAMGDYDVVACGGTHVRNTAEVLPVKLVGSERVRGGLTRVTFRAGAEALQDYAVKHDVLRRASPLLSAPVDEVPVRVTALLDRVANLETALGGTLRQAAAQLAASLVRDSETSLEGGTRLIVHAIKADQEDLFEPLIAVLQREPACVALLGVQAASGARLAFLAGPGTGVDVRPALQAALAPSGGRGGGRPDRAQGALPAGASLEPALAAGADRLRNASRT